MGRIVLKERVFTPVGKNLGTFSAVDLEPFDLQYKESDEPSKGGNSGQGEKRRVPDPVDHNKIEPLTNPNNGGNQGGSDSLANQGEKGEEGRYQKPDEVDLNGEDIDNENWDNPNNEKPEVGGGASGGDDSDSGDDSGNRDDSNNGESGEDTGNSDSSNSGNGSDNGDGGNKSDTGNSDSSNNGDKGENGENGEDGDINNNQNNSNGSNSDNGDEGQNDKSGRDGGQSSSGQAGHGGSGNGGQSSRSFWGDDDDPSDFGDLDSGGDSSELGKAVNKINDSQTESQKEQRKAEEELEKKEEEDNKELTESEKRDKINRAKETLSNGVRDAKKDSNDEESNSNPNKYDDTDGDENDLLGKLGAGELTSLVQTKMKAGWRRMLDKLLDTALGLDIVHNPNLINKKIEDAPPGREDDESKLSNIVVLIDCSGSMGAMKFKQVISHMDTMLSAKKLGDVRFHIMGWADGTKETVLKTYRKVKGRQFKKTAMEHYSWTGGGTEIEGAIEATMSKVKNPDAIMIFTDGEIWDDRIREKNKTVDRFFTKYRKRIIWVLTADAKLDGFIKKVDPYSVKRKQYIKFKKD